MTKVVLKCPSCGHMIDFGPNWVPVDLSKPHTNADRIRAMTDEELAKKMSGLESFALTCGGGWPPEKWLVWLKEEVESNDS